MVDGRAAAQTLLSYRGINPGLCLHYVWQAYKAHGARATGTYPTAYSAWNASPGKHHGDRNPPAGVPVWWGPRAGSAAGDVVISLGGGRVAATDYPRNGVVGSCTIDERERQIGRPYLGWTETILGARIDYQSQSADVGSGQRTAGPNGAKRRTSPSSQSPEAGEYLAAGVVGNFTGWIRGESVQGNNVWYQGVSGDWFWSGGFNEGANGTGLKDLNAPAAASHQRIVGGTPVNGRGAPNTTSPVVQTLDAGTVADFNGWTLGQSVEGNDIWYRGAHSGNWFWSGGFTSRSTAGLPEVSATPIAASNERVVGGTPANGRSGPARSNPVVQTLDAGTVGTFNGWTNGESVEGVDIWFRGALSGNWFWAGGFTSRSTDGLERVNTGTAPTPTPNPTPAPDGLEADFTPDLITPTASDFPAWIRFETVLDPDGQKADLNKGAAAYYGVRYGPIESHVHWWNEPSKGGTHDGNVSYIQRTVDLSVNFVTSPGRVTLMVPINKIALTTGRRNPYAWKSENDPLITTSADDLGYRTLGYLHYIVEKLNPSLRGEPIRRHNEVLPGTTSCSNIDTAKVRRIADQFANGELDPATGLPPATEPDPVDPEPTPPAGDSAFRAFLLELSALIKKFLGT